MLRKAGGEKTHPNLLWQVRVPEAPPRRDHVTKCLPSETWEGQVLEQGACPGTGWGLWRRPQGREDSISTPHTRPLNPEVTPQEDSHGGQHGSVGASATTHLVLGTHVAPSCPCPKPPRLLNTPQLPSWARRTARTAPTLCWRRHRLPPLCHHTSAAKPRPL